MKFETFLKIMGRISIIIIITISATNLCDLRGLSAQRRVDKLPVVSTLTYAFSVSIRLSVFINDFNKRSRYEPHTPLLSTLIDRFLLSCAEYLDEDVEKAGAEKSSMKKQLKMFKLGH